MIRVLICDDHPVVRAGLRALLSIEPDIEIVGEAETGERAVTLAREQPADVILMDLQFGGGLDGVVATRAIMVLEEHPRVLVVTNYDTDADILGAVEAGAAGYLLKDAPPEELLEAVRSAAAGHSAVAPAITARLLAQLRSPQARLSARELEVVQLVADGLSNAEIAARLYIGETTVKTHLVHIFDKFDVGSRTAAVSAARRAGLLRSTRN